MFDPSLLTKLNDMKAMADSSKERLNGITVEGEAGGGLIVVSMNGNREIKSVKLNTELQYMTKEDLEDLLTVALTRAMEAANNLNEQETMAAAKNLFPGL